jgi:hypothetical protein
MPVKIWIIAENDVFLQLKCVYYMIYGLDDFNKISYTRFS